jgi:hypothetical protein|tara:strand:- start:579 stop:830 length:252 start_codon:yes stop_codon:yes gene_type:complete
MRIDYNRLLELNKEALVDDDRTQMNAYYVIQITIEKFISGEHIAEEAKNLLIELGVLELSEEDIAREKIVGPFNFSQHGSTNF